MLRLGIVAGETSGDRLGAGLIKALKALEPDLRAEGIAGEQMLEAGCLASADIERLAVMGISEVLVHYPRLKYLQIQTVRYFLDHRPDIFVGIDAPEFNLGIERRLRKAGVKTIHYVSPQVWAWREGRVRTIGKSTDRVLTLFPFEADFYRKHDVSAIFVGHPLADEIPIQTDKRVARQSLKVLEDARVLAILPGSRMTELKQLLPAFMATAGRCVHEMGSLECISAAVSADAERLIQEAAVAADVRVKVFRGRAREVLGACDAALLASGTAALEAMLIKRPMVVAYRLARSSYQLLRHFIQGPLYAMPNILAGRELVPEFIQNDVKPETMSEPLLRWLREPESIGTMIERFEQIHRQLRCGANERAARAVLDCL